MTRFVNAANAIGGGAGSYIQSVWDEERTTLHRVQDQFIFHYRNPAYLPYLARQPFFEMWPVKSGFTQDNCGVIGNDCYTGNGDGFEPSHMGETGIRSAYFVKGQVLSSSGVATSGATVKIFRTSDDLYIASGVSDANGYYSVPTPFDGVSHYAVGYLTGSPDTAGTTVNNITPTAS